MLKYNILYYRNTIGVFLSKKSGLVLVEALLVLAGCASTSTQLDPSPQSPVCHHTAHAMVLWTTNWRADQKDVLAREAAASEGITQFFSQSGCFASAHVRHVPQSSLSLDITTVAGADALYDRLVVLTVRELGPILKIGSSVALVEGGTEVVLDVAEYKLPSSTPRNFSIHWRHGGPGVMKGVASLPQDMRAALTAGMQPGR